MKMIELLRSSEIELRDACETMQEITALNLATDDLAALNSSHALCDLECKLDIYKTVRLDGICFTYVYHNGELADDNYQSGNLPASNEGPVLFKAYTTIGLLTSEMQNAAHWTSESMEYFVNSRLSEMRTEIQNLVKEVEKYGLIDASYEATAKRFLEIVYRYIICGIAPTVKEAYDSDEMRTAILRYIDRLDINGASLMFYDNQEIPSMINMEYLDGYDDQIKLVAAGEGL